MYKKIILGTVLIFAVFYGLYLTVSPIAKQKLAGDDIDPVSENVQDAGTYATDTPSAASGAPAQQKPSTQPSTPVQPASEKPQPTPEPVQAGVYTLAEVGQHANEQSCWSIVNGSVYDLTSYISKHPGGASRILRICGKDGTSAFEGQHGGESKPERILETYKIGILTQ